MRGGVWDVVRCGMRVVVTSALLVCSALVACSASATPVTIIGTSDLHGRVERVAVLAGNLAAVRAEVKKSGGVVLWVDAGDLFQGTLESNLVEGKSVIDVYNLVKPDAVAIGNHEFDFGPVGPMAIPKTAKDDPRGALKARITEAKFPFLAANLIDDATNKPVAWARPSVMVTKGGVRIGIIGVTTIETAHTTSAANFIGLKVTSLREAIAAEADALKSKGAQVIVVAAHAGGKCGNVDNPDDASSCEQDAEIFQLARSLPQGLVDVIVAAHTHQQVAQVVNGIPIIESWANGKGFGRVDLDVGKAKVTLQKIHKPQAMCLDDNAAECVPADYHGVRVVPDAKIAAVVAPYVASSKKAKERLLGVVVKHEVKRGYDQESALGNLFADLMLDAGKDAGMAPDIAIMNGGGMRANFPEGPLTYGALFEMMPFDNRFAKITTTGQVLREWLESNLSARKGGILSVSGVSAVVTCEGKKAHVALQHKDGKPLADTEHVVIVTTDFLASGGEATRLPEGSVALDDGDPIREFVARALAKRGGVLDGEDPALLQKRISPGRCKAD